MDPITLSPYDVRIIVLRASQVDKAQDNVRFGVTSIEPRGTLPQAVLREVRFPTPGTGEVFGSIDPNALYGWMPLATESSFALHDGLSTAGILTPKASDEPSPLETTLLALADFTALIAFLREQVIADVEIAADNDDLVVTAIALARRVTDDAAAKMRILDRFEQAQAQGGPTEWRALLDLAQSYEDDPGFEPSWRL